MPLVEVVAPQQCAGRERGGIAQSELAQADEQIGDDDDLLGHRVPDSNGDQHRDLPPRAVGVAGDQGCVHPHRVREDHQSEAGQSDQGGQAQTVGHIPAGGASGQADHREADPAAPQQVSRKHCHPSEAHHGYRLASRIDPGDIRSATG